MNGKHQVFGKVLSGMEVTPSAIRSQRRGHYIGPTHLIITMIIMIIVVV